MKEALEEDPVEARWDAVVVEAEAAAGDPAWEQRGLSSAEPEYRLVYSRTEHQHCCLNVLGPLNATVTLNTHHHTIQHCCRAVAQTGAVSGAAFVAAASAGGAAPAGWRTASRWTGPRSCRTPWPVRRGRDPVAYEAQALHSFATEVHHNFPRRGTLLGSEAVCTAFVLIYSRA